MMNKKAQYYQQPPQREPFKHLNLFIIFGVIVFVIPHFSALVLKTNLPGWIMYIGVAFIILGVAKAAYETLMD